VVDGLVIGKRTAKLRRSGATSEVKAREGETCVDQLERAAHLLLF
jgi:hypothetical protein